MRSCEGCSARGSGAGGAGGGGGGGVVATADIVAGVELPEVGGEGLGAENRCRVCWGGPGGDEELSSGEVAMWETELMAVPSERGRDCAGKSERRFVVVVVIVVVVAALRGGGGGGGGDEAIRLGSGGSLFVLFVFSI